MSKHRIGILLGAVLLLATGWTAFAAAATSTGTNRSRAVASSAATAQSLNGIHDPLSRNYDSRCLKCHASVLTDKTSDPRILTFHQAMLPYTPGYNSRKGAQDKNCLTCHRDAIDFNQESGSSLRRTVSVESCVYCHGPAGPGPTYYK